MAKQTKTQAEIIAEAEEALIEALGLDDSMDLEIKIDIFPAAVADEDDGDEDGFDDDDADEDEEDDESDEDESEDADDESDDEDEDAEEDEDEEDALDPDSVDWSEEGLKPMNIGELRAWANYYEIDHKGMNKKALIDALLAD